MPENPFETMLFVSVQNSEGRTLEDSSHLVTELLEFDFDNLVILNGGSVPKEVKTADPVTAGAIILGISAASIPSMILFLQSWLLRQKDQKIKVKIGEVEVEVPRDVNQDEVNRVIQMVQKAAERKKTK